MSTKNIPSEILSEIFLLTLPDNVKRLEHGSKFQVRGQVDIPNSIAAVCTHWRATAIGTSGLWSSIFVEVTPEDKIRPPLDSIALWLERSNGQLLSWSVEHYAQAKIPDKDEDEDGEEGSDDEESDRDRHESIALNSVLDLFKEQSKRWRWIELYLPNTESLPTPLRGLLKDETPALEDVMVMAEDCETSELLPVLNTCTHIHLQYDLSTEDLLSLLGECPDLVDLSINMAFSEFEESDSDAASNASDGGPKTGEHSTLRSFGIYAKDNLNPMFNRLTLPALETLDITGENMERSDESGPSIKNFITRSKCSLRDLSLDSTCLSEEDLVLILSACPSLQDLFVRDEAEPLCFGDDVIAKMRVKPDYDSVVLCGQLRKLYVSTCLNATDGAFGEMLLSRKLELVRLTIDKAWEEGHPSDMKALKSLESLETKVDLDFH